MKLQRILCPVDFSDHNQSANDYASALAASTGAKIFYLHTFLPDVPFGDPALFDQSKESDRLLKELKAFIKPTNDLVEAEYLVEFGTPANRIVRTANDLNADLIVLGTHGRSGLNRLLMGSVAESVVRRSDCPVLALKTEPKKTEAEPAESESSIDNTHSNPPASNVKSRRVVK